MPSELSQVTAKLRLAFVISIGLVVFALFQIWILGLQLPLEVPIHFDLNGDRDRFSSRSEFLWSMTGLVVGSTALLLVLSWVTPKIPDSMVNLPNKEYWLAPERREIAHKRMQLMLVWVGTLTTLLFSSVAFLSWMVGMKYSTSISPWIWLVVVAYTVAITYMCLTRFRKDSIVPSSEHATSS